MSVRSLAAVAIVATVGVAPGAGAEVRVAQPREGIDRLLLDASLAFERSDRALYGRTLQPGPFAQRRLRAFDNAAGVGFDKHVFEVTTQFSADLAGPRVRGLYPDRQVVAYHVLERTRIAGVEARDFVEDSFFTFVRDGPDPGDRYDGWRLAADDDFVALGLHSAGHLWDAAPVEVVRGEHFVVLTHAGERAQARAIGELADAVYEEVDAFWPRPVSERFAIIVPSTTAELGRILRTTFDLSKFVAFAVAGADRSDGWEPGGARIFVHLQRFERHETGFRRETMAHELIHAVTRPVSGPHIPVWVEEGLASVGSEEGSGLSVARQGPTPADFPADDRFSVGPARDIVRTYRRSQVAVGILLERSGAEGLARFYEALGRARVTPGTTAFHLDRALREAVDWSLEGWRQAWLERIG